MDADEKFLWPKEVRQVIPQKQTANWTIFYVIPVQHLSDKVQLTNLHFQWQLQCSFRTPQT